MSIGIIGSGAIGAAFAQTLSRAGVEAIISNSRGPDSLKELVREIGPSIAAGTREEAPVRCFQLEPVFLADRFFVDRVFGVRLGKIGAFGRRHRPLSNTVFRLPPR